MLCFQVVTGNPTKMVSHLLTVTAQLLGVYFVDRNPNHFDRILDYLRTGRFTFEGLDSIEKTKLKSDLDYYQIDLPEEVKFVFPESKILTWKHWRQ
jgi:hypothetical protein